MMISFIKGGGAIQTKIPPRTSSKELQATLGSCNVRVYDSTKNRDWAKTLLTKNGFLYGAFLLFQSTKRFV